VFYSRLLLPKRAFSFLVSGIRRPFSVFGLSLSLIYLLMSQALLQANSYAQDIPLPKDAFKVTLTNPTAGEITLDWLIMEDTYLYQSAFTATTTAASVRFLSLNTENGELKDDPNFGKVTVHYQQAHSKLYYQYTGEQPITIPIEVTSQGCHDIGICYPPQRETHKLQILPTSAETADKSTLIKSTNSVDSAANNDSLFLDNLLGSANNNTAMSNDVFGDQSAQGVIAPDKAFKADLLITGDTLFAQFTIDNCCYIYQDKLSISTENNEIVIGQSDFPPAIDHEDNNFGKVKIYNENFGFETPFHNPNPNRPITFTLHYQGCAKQGICYPPDSRQFTIDLPTGNLNPNANTNNTTSGKSQTGNIDNNTGSNQTAATVANDQDRIAKKLLTDGYNALIWFFFAGVLLSLTPCIFPMIPILSGIIVGQGTEISKWRAFAMSFCYVIGMAITYTLAGVVAGLLGANLQIAFQNPWVLATFAGIFVLFALAMFDIFNLQVPSAMQTKINNVSQKLGGNLFSVFLMGALSALIVGPCVAPPLAGALSVIASTGDPMLGGAALFALSIGMGLPLLLVGTSAGALLPKAGAWMEAVKIFFGLLMLGVAIILIERVISGSTTLLLWGGLFILTAVFCGAFEQLPKPASTIQVIFKSLGLIAAMIGALQIIGSAMGNDDIYHPLESHEANQKVSGTAIKQNQLDFITITSPEQFAQVITANKGKKILLDFYADWCTYCKDYEKYTFTDPAVQAELQDFVLVKADITKNDAGNKALLSQYQIIAPPAILFFDAEGKELRNYRLFTYQPADDFLKHIQQFN
jgi:thiol:disulfide interchange protein DsbD